jgi:DNA adenine methylase
MKSPIRWAGSKRQTVGLLRKYWTGGRYIEPFAGSACLFFDLEPSEAILGDLNWELTTAMQALKSDVEKILSILRGLPTGSDAYYRVRKLDPTRLDHSTLAARFLYLNRYCFNGLYRTNLRGQFNVPYGPPKSGRGVDEDLIRKAASLLRRATIMKADFEATVSLAGEGDFIYLDPPYVVSSRRVFREYLPESFSARDLSRLEELLRELDRKGASFVITYGDSPEARKLLRKWVPRRIRTRRNIAGFASDRRVSYELLATNAEVATS